MDLTLDAARLTAQLVDTASVSGEEKQLADAVETALRALGHLEVDRDGDAVVARTRLGRAERVVLAGLQLGIMQACLDTVIPYVRERKQFGTAIGTFQLMQAKVADMYVALQSARAYVYAVARACDAGQTTRFDAAGAILLASESAFRVAGEAVQALGGAGYTKDWPVERYLRDAKLLDIGAGTNEIRRMLIGRELIGTA